MTTFTPQDAKKHNGKLTPRQRRQWAHAANKALAECRKRDLSEQLSMNEAISAANAQIMPKQERGDENYEFDPELVNELIAELWERKVEVEDDMTEENTVSESEVTKVREFDQGFYSIASMISKRFYVMFNRENEYYGIKDIYFAHPELGDSVVCESESCIFYQVAYSWDEISNDVNFADRESWTQVRQTYVPIMSTVETEAAEIELEESEPEAATITESWTPGTDLQERIVIEESALNTGDRRLPLTVKMRLIKPGFGNARDKHYYSSEMLSENASKFAGVKMYVTDHRPDEMSERTEVATIDKVEVGVDGSPIGSVIIFDPDFAEKTRNRAIANKLNTLECSIVASGSYVRGKVDGKDARIVTGIDEVRSVDFVTRAGAGGQALEIQEKEVVMEKEIEPVIEMEAETEAEPVAITENEPEPEPIIMLAETEVSAVVNETKLPRIAKDRLLKEQYETAEQLHDAIAAEVDYITKLTGAGKPFSQGGESVEQKPAKMTEAESQEWFSGLLLKYGV